MAAATAQQQFRGFLAKYDPEIAAIATRAVRKMRALIPEAIEIVYDNYNALVIGFGPTERASDAIVSLALYPRWVTLFFLDGRALSDPERLLKGTGVRVRHIVLKSADDLDRSGMRALVKQAVAAADVAFGARRRLVIKSVSQKQRPRRAAK